MIGHLAAVTDLIALKMPLIEAVQAVKDSEERYGEAFQGLNVMKEELIHCTVDESYAKISEVAALEASVEQLKTTYAVAQANCVGTGCASISQDGTIRIWLSDGTCTDVLQGPVEGGMCLALTTRPTGEGLVLLLGTKRGVQLWSVEKFCIDGEWRCIGPSRTLTLTRSR